MNGPADEACMERPKLLQKVSSRSEWLESGGAPGKWEEKAEEGATGEGGRDQIRKKRILMFQEVWPLAQRQCGVSTRASLGPGDPLIRGSLWQQHWGCVGRQWHSKLVKELGQNCR